MADSSTTGAPVAPADKDVEMKDVASAETAAEDAKPSTSDPSQPAAEATDKAPNANGETESATATVSTPAPKKETKRKSVGGTPASKRKKSAPEVHTNVKPGEHWFVRMKGYTPWPAIVCDEQMLPLSLLEKRPVSAMRPDGTWREDFAEGGKNVKDRRYPVLFLGTYEFGWQINTELAPLDMDDVKETVSKGDQGKKSKALWSAFEEASQDHDLEYYRNLLEDHEKQRKEAEEAAIALEEAKAAEAAERKAKKEEKKKSQSQKKDADGDTEMKDADGEKKATKKRKKEEGDADSSKSKTKIVLKGLKSSGEGEEPSAKKARKSKTEEDKSEPQMSEEEILKRKEKHVLFLRHKLQKGLASKDTPPKAEDMPSMVDHLSALENFADLEPVIIRETKVAKLLKVILKNEIPRDDEFKFKDRCSKLLAGWTSILAADDVKRDESEPANGSTGAKKEAEKLTNGKTGDHSEEKQASASAKEEKKEEVKSEAPTVAA